MLIKVSVIVFVNYDFILPRWLLSQPHFNVVCAPASHVKVSQLAQEFQLTECSPKFFI